MELEQPFDGKEPLLDSLGVVEAIDAHAEQRVGVKPISRDHAAPALGDRRLLREPAVGHSIEIGYGRTSVVWPPRTTAALRVDAGLEVAIHRVEEVVAMHLGVKPEDAAAEHPVEELLPPWADAELSALGQGMCQNMMIVARGSRSRISCGTSAKW